MSSKDTQKVIEGFDKDRRRRKLAKGKKVHQNPRQPRPPRRSDWLDLADEDATDLDHDLSNERVMPRGERDRRKAVEQAMLGKAVRNPDEDINQPAGVEGRVTEVSGNLFRVRINDQALLCTLRGSLEARETGFTNSVTVGDRVLVNENDTGHGVIEDVLPRRGVIARSSPGTVALQQLVAANIDQLLIVASWRNPKIWPELIDRYLITALRSEIVPLICINKIDLATNPHEIEAALAPYGRIGYQMFLTSADTGAGVDGLRDSLAGKTTALTGLSGVGKSSLLNAIDPGFELHTGTTNEARGQGRHTTTQATMLPLGAQGYVIDTPGIREFGLVGLRQDEVAGFYPEIAAHAGACQFTDCSHQHEPSCAVQKAIEAGAISPVRFHSFLNIRSSLPA